VPGRRLLGIDREFVNVDGLGVEAEADWDHLRTPETYLGYERSEHFVSPNAPAFNQRRAYELPRSLRLNHWALSGDWTMEEEATTLNTAPAPVCSPAP
jgi:hypothetical protein